MLPYRSFFDFSWDSRMRPGGYQYNGAQYSSSAFGKNFGMFLTALILGPAIFFRAPVPVTVK